jgi:hypothetical protein
MKTTVLVLLALVAGAAQAATIADPTGSVSGQAAAGGGSGAFSATGVPVFGEAQAQGDGFAYAFASVEAGALAAGAEILGGSGSATASFAGTLTGSMRLFIEFESIVLGLGPDVSAGTELAFSVTQDGNVLVDELFTFDGADTLLYATTLDLGGGLADFAIRIGGSAAAGGLAYATSVAFANVTLAAIPLPPALFALGAALLGLAPCARRRSCA